MTQSKLAFCPWLGTDEDQQIRYNGPDEGHACYARKRLTAIDLGYQARFCLMGSHVECPYYREPPEPSPPPEAVPVEEDEVAPSAVRFGRLQAVLWVGVILAAAAAVYFYGSMIFGVMLPTTRAAAAGPSPSPTASPSSTATVTATATATATRTEEPLPVFEFVDPTALPTPFPGGSIYSLSPGPGAAGWVVSDESRGNHLGDSYLYTGIFDGVIFHGVFQFDLSAVPRGATIYAGVLEITGLDARRLGDSGAWEVRVLAPEVDEGWSRRTYQELHNAVVQWTLLPALGTGDVAEGETDTFELPREVTRDLEERLLGEHYTVSFRLDGPLTGENSVYAWDTGNGPASKDRGPRLILNVGPRPETPIPTGPVPPTVTPTPSNTPTPSVTPTPSNTPVWVVVTSTPTPGNAVTAAAMAANQTAWATTTGTATAMPEFVATATPRYVVVTNTPTPGNRATAEYQQALATAKVILSGTPTPLSRPLATATNTPQPTATRRTRGAPGPTRTPVIIWLDDLGVGNLPTPTPTAPPIPARLRGNILFLSDRSGREGVYMIDPDSGRVAWVTARWPYDEVRKTESFSSDGLSRAFVRTDSKGVAQVWVDSRYYDSSWQVTFNTGMSYSPVWSPVGERLAFVSAEDGSDDIFVINADGKGQRRLTFNEWEWDKHPSWSPDGSQIVFWSNQGTGRRQLWIMNANGSGRRPLLDSAFNDWDPIWVK